MEECTAPGWFVTRKKGTKAKDSEVPGAIQGQGTEIYIDVPKVKKYISFQSTDSIIQTYDSFIPIF